MKKALLFGTTCLLAASAFVSCGKEQESTNGDNSQPQKHNVELKYDGRTGAGCVNVAMDTISKYIADPTVDTIFMIPDPIDQFATWNAQNMQSVANYLRQRHNVNPKKVFGKGDIKLYDYPQNSEEKFCQFMDNT